MKNQEISFLKSYKFFGDFYIEKNKEKYAGHLVYTPNKEFYLDLMNNNTSENIFIRKIKVFHGGQYHRTKGIVGDVICEENNYSYSVKLINPRTSMPLSVFSPSQRFFFDGLIFTTHISQNKKVKNIEIKYTGFDKFCCPDIYDGRVPDKSDILDVRLRDKRNIKLNYSYNIKNFDKVFMRSSVTLPA